MDTNILIKRFECDGVRHINSSTALNTYEVVHTDKFFTKGINNRDNARWKRAQYIFVEGCSYALVRGCLDGFYEFAESCQYIIFANLDLAYNGIGHNVSIESIYLSL
jgi:hypothetical protein